MDLTLGTLPTDEGRALKIGEESEPTCPDNEEVCRIWYDNMP